ncbi:MAG: M20/M25/M40 family metallo-hydrolase, partial [Deltaproteobacteria bacterium]|nr:M20/M25/M40 family metallo-hydrolase [Deltaproteobacteria bacterium]
MTTSDESRNPTESVSRATIDSLVDLRHHLHQIAELSGEERNTAKYVRDFLKKFHPDELITGIGGHGLAAVYHGRSRDGAILLRADLDGLPIPESLKLDHKSTAQNVSHKCGHDGHIAMLAGVAGWLVKQKDRPTDVVLLFQPSEETGQGANRVLHDPRFANITPSLVFALHNLP